ncbi:unnamed protein product [Vitrella brassicaformis CCMP3155]|uniref:Uncharacterized protein n=1 Tax=Vitrella brassicaformis (strain CCMP3155) TaxID=1169540 RepID=A0A0G4GMQ1_VITBC|nr:unnamed protein product [Vitrella brassicaformis CCMP3155]|eukprot:CEM31410.1 unnamed protein product [Vitrella brassicaformis CCMP3155]
MLLSQPADCGAVLGLVVCLCNLTEAEKEESQMQQGDQHPPPPPPVPTADDARQAERETEDLRAAKEPPTDGGHDNVRSRAEQVQKY